MFLLVHEFIPISTIILIKIIAINHQVHENKPRAQITLIWRHRGFDRDFLRADHGEKNIVDERLSLKYRGITTPTPLPPPVIFDS